MPSPTRLFPILAALVFGAALVGAPLPASAAKQSVAQVSTRYDFKTMVDRLKDAVAKHGLLVVGVASPSAGAEMRGLHIAGDAVVMVFNNDYALRMLRASVDSGLEAPIHIHVFETSDGTARVAYRLPSAVFAPYGVPALRAMGKELDTVFAAIVAEAVGP